MKIAMMSRWNVPCGVSLHAELVGREWARMGHDLSVFAPVEYEGYKCDEDEAFVTRCYMLREYRTEKSFFFDPHPFLEQEYDIFVVQNLEILPMEDLLGIYHEIKRKAKTVFVVHEGTPPKDPVFYKFDWDAIVCFDERYRNFLQKIYGKGKIRIIPYPCHPVVQGDKFEARRKLGLPEQKKIIFNYGIGIYRHIHLLPSLERFNRRYPLMLLSITHIQDWYELFDALRKRYPFIELRKGDIPIRELYTYLHASDALLVHKDSAEAIVVPSTVHLCLGSGCPILAYDTNFFETFNDEVIKYSKLEDVLPEIFNPGERVQRTLQRALQYASINSAYKIGASFIQLFESLMEPLKLPEVHGNMTAEKHKAPLSPVPSAYVQPSSMM